MIAASVVTEILPGVFRWAAYSPAHKVELTSHGVRDGAAFLVFDPIPLESKTANGLPAASAIVLTNENHERDAADWRTRSAAELWAAPDANLTLTSVRRWTPPGCPFSGWELIPLPGGAGGETAFHWRAGSLVVFGDALVHLAGRGLEVLPDRYCRDPARLRVSLGTLPTFEHAVFAHGEPLLGGASARIQALLRGSEGIPR